MIFSANSIQGFAMAFLLAISSRQAVMGEGIPHPYDPMEMLCIVNRQRVRFGFRPLAIIPVLTATAAYHSAEMAFNHRMTHADAKGRSLKGRVAAMGYAGRVWLGENLAFGMPTGARAMQRWMFSPSHRANLLSPDYSFFGSAVAYTSHGVPYYTQHFAGDGVDRVFPECPAGEKAYAGISATYSDPLLAAHSSRPGRPKAVSKAPRKTGKALMIKPRRPSAVVTPSMKPSADALKYCPKQSTYIKPGAIARISKNKVGNQTYYHCIWTW